MHTHACALIRTHARTQTDLIFRTHPPHTHTHTHAHTHTHVHTTHTHTHTCTHTSFPTQYKESLVGGRAVPHQPDNPSRVIVHSMVITAGDRKPFEVTMEELAGDDCKSITIKEGATYRVGIRYYVQHDVVLGLKFTSSIKKFKVYVSKETYVVISLSPSTYLSISRSLSLHGLPVVYCVFGGHLYFLSRTRRHRMLRTDWELRTKDRVPQL